MRGRVFIYDEELKRCVEVDSGPYENKSAYIRQDTMKALRHPVTGKMYDSVSEYEKETRRLGLTICGNDLQSQRKRQTRDHMTERVIMDRMERAEAIHSDPARFRARLNENLQRAERWERLVHGRK